MCLSKLTIRTEIDPASVIKAILKSGDPLAFIMAIVEECEDIIFAGNVADAVTGWKESRQHGFPSSENLLKTVNYLLDDHPYTIRDYSGVCTGSRKIEYIPGSLALTFAAMHSRIQELEQKNDALKLHLELPPRWNTK